MLTTFNHENIELEIVLLFQFQINSYPTHVKFIKILTKCLKIINELHVVYDFFMLNV